MRARGSGVSEYYFCDGVGCECFSVVVSDFGFGFLEKSELEEVLDGFFRVGFREVEGRGDSPVGGEAREAGCGE